MLVVPVLKDERQDGKTDADKDHDEDAANVVNGNSAARVLVVLARLLGGVLIPPALLQSL